MCETMPNAEEEGGGGGVREGRRVCVCELRLRGSDAKFRYCSLQKLIESLGLRGNISYHTHTHKHTYTSHLSERDDGSVHDMRAVSSEVGVLLLFNNEGQVVRGVA